MTTRELRNDVSALCFYDIGEKDEQFISYANLALRTIYNELDILGKHTIYLNTEKAVFFAERILHKGGESEILPLDGKAYSLFAVGCGKITVNDKNTSTVKDFDTEGTAFRGFLSGGGTLTLSGDYSFAIYSLAVFSEITSENEADIPLISGYQSYNMRELVNDFQSFYLPPVDNHGKSVEGAVYADGILSIKGYQGDSISITYRRLPKRIYIDFPDIPVDLPEEYTQLLVTLCAYFICLEDDRDNAERYRELYNSLLASHKTNCRERLGADTVLTNGWA